MPGRSVVLVAVLTVAPVDGHLGASAGPPRITHGIAAGEVTERSAVLWARCDRPATLHVTVGGQPPAAARASAERDGIAQVVADGLAPATSYPWQARCDDGAAVGGAFRTAPEPAASAPVRLAWSGDLGGQNACRDASRGYPIFAAIAARAPDVFVALGDLVYADAVCQGVGRYGNVQVPGPGPAADLEGFRAHWRYNRDDRTFRRLLATTSIIGVWDDHEVRDDFGPGRDAGPGGVPLLPLGRQAFTEWTPLRPGPFYRARRWGRHVELLVLDTRSARDPNDAADLAERPKSMLGAAQRAWLESAVGTDATWLVVVSSVPLSIPTGAWVRDGWASDGGPTGFARELAQLLRLLRDRGRRQVIWITTDVHFSAILQHRPLADDPGFVVYEIAVGPLNAGIAAPKAPDPGYGTRPLFVLGPDVWQTVRTLDEALGYFTFGLLEFDAGGGLAAEVVDATGRVHYRLDLVP